MGEDPKVPTPSVQVSMGGDPKVPTPHPGQDEGVPQGTYPLSRSASVQVRMGRGVYPKVPTPPSRSGWGYPKVPIPSRSGQEEGVPQGTYPPIQVKMGEGVPQRTYPRNRTSYGLLDTLWSVCLLRSHRRTFLLRQMHLETDLRKHKSVSCKL